jgi:RNA polymerase sigma-70 factor (ECF subfamily)
MTSEDEEFSLFFSAHFPSLRRFLDCLLGRGHGVAEEVAQEAFARLYHTGFRSLPPGEARFWLFRVARNLALNELEKGRTRRRLVTKIMESMRPNIANPEREYETNERRRILQDLLSSLPETQRAAILLREQESMSYAEIARVLSVSESKVKIDLYRARADLRERWKNLQAKVASATG